MGRTVSVVISIPGFLAPEWASGVRRIEKRPNFHIVRRKRNWKEPQYLKEALEVKQIVCILHRAIWTHSSSPYPSPDQGTRKIELWKKMRKIER